MKQMKVCVSCEKDVSGKEAFPIREDRVIRAIRSVKKALRVAQMNELYVCKDCLEGHKKKRKSFEKTMIFASILGALLALLVLLSPVLSGRIDPLGVLSGLLLALLVFTLPIYFKYAPAVEDSVSVPVTEPLVKAVRPERSKTESAAGKTKRKTRKK